MNIKVTERDYRDIKKKLERVQEWLHGRSDNYTLAFLHQVLIEHNYQERALNWQVNHATPDGKTDVPPPTV